MINFAVKEKSSQSTNLLRALRDEENVVVLISRRRIYGN